MSAHLQIASVLLVPFLSAVVVFLCPKKWLGLNLTVFISLCSVTVGWFAFGLDVHQVVRHAVSGWPTPLGIGLYVDGLSAIMLLLTAAVGAPIGAYAFGYFHRLAIKNSESAYAGFWPVYFFLWGALNAIFVVADIFTVYVCLELITLSAVACIVLERGPKALKASMRYLMAALMGSLMYLLGVALLYSALGALDWPTIAALKPAPKSILLPLSLLTAGLLIKSALFPLHFWLPDAHAIAAPPVSALLSALVVKASFYILLRLWMVMLPEATQTYAVHVIGVLGAIAIIWGSFQAIIQNRIKLLIAYSTVAQLGYLFLAFPIFGAAYASGDAKAKLDVWNGVVYFVISHGIAKAALFLVSGIYLTLEGSDEIKDLGGAAAKAPIATLTWGLAGISLIGLPPSGGFLAKWLLLTSSIRFALWPYAAVILIGGLLASIYVFRILWHAFLTEDMTEPRPLQQRLPRTMPMAALFLGVLAIWIGVRSAELFTLIQIGLPYGGGAP